MAAAEEPAAAAAAAPPQVELDSVVWVKQGSSRYWPCVSRALDSVGEDALRRELQNQMRKIQTKHPDRVATGANPTMVLVEFLGSHDYAWAQVHRVELFRSSKEAPDGPTVSTDEYHEAVNRLTGYSGAVKEAEEYTRELREAQPKPKKPRSRADGGDGKAEDRKRQRKEKEEKEKKARAPSANAAAEVKEIAALNKALAKQIQAAEKERPPPAVVSGRSRRASTAASSRATSQEEVMRLLQQQMASDSHGS